MNSNEKVINSINNNYNLNLDNDSSLPIEIDFDTLDNSRFIISLSVKEKLNNIALTTTTNLNEIGFIMYGKEYSENQVLFDSLTISDAKEKSSVTEFGPIITSELENTIKENFDERTVVCYGHTHPPISDDYDNFSLSDLASLIDLTNLSPDFKNKNIQLVGCLLTTTLKFVYYNPDDDKFYSIKNIEYRE